MRVIHFEHKDRTAIVDSARLLREHLRGHQRRPIAAAEAATLSGLPLDMAESALLALYSMHPATLKVDDDGTLWVTFASLDRRGGAGVAQRCWRWMARQTAPSLTRAREAIADLLVITLLPMLMLVLAGNIAGLAAPLTLDFPGVAVLRIFPGVVVFMVSGLMVVLAGISLLLELLLLAGPLLCAMGVGVLGVGIRAMVEGDAGGAAAGIIGALVFLAMGIPWSLFALEQFREMSDRNDPDAPYTSLWLPLRGFVFGPHARPGDEPIDALVDERRFTALLAERRGVVLVRDLVCLFGLTVSQAEGEISRLLLDYGGDIQVGDDAQPVYVFRGWQDPGVAVAADLRPAWERLGAPPRFWGVQRAEVWTISGLLLAGLAGLGISQLVFPGEPLLTPSLSSMLSGLSSMRRDGMTTLFTFWRGCGGWLYLAIAAVVVTRLPGWALRVTWHRWWRGRLARLQTFVDQAAVGGWHDEGPHWAEMGAEIDETMGCRDGQYFLRCPALRQMETSTTM